MRFDPVACEHGGGKRTNPRPVVNLGRCRVNAKQKSKNPAEGVFSEIGGVAMSAVLHIFKLTAAELVLVQETDPVLFEKAVHMKLDQFTSPTHDAEAWSAGLACARYLIDQVVSVVLTQADIKRSLSVPHVTSGAKPRPPSLFH